jgi:leishmanolysin-like peptidase
MSSLRHAILFAAYFFVVSIEGGTAYTCQHSPPSVHQLSYAALANTHSEDHRRKRQSESEFKPIRIKAIFGSTVEALPADQQKLLKVDTVQYVVDFFERALTVRPLQGNILFQRTCNGTSTTHLNRNGFCPRSEGCIPYSLCVLTLLPNEHLAACKVCNDDGTNCQTIGQDGEGVTDADFVLYVTADTNLSKCNPGVALAFATPCQLEKEYDRPVAGWANVCVNRAFNDGLMNLRSILIHEISHALVFSSVLYAFYRDANGNPRSARRPDGLPKNYVRSKLAFTPDETTIAKKEVRRTTFPNGTFSYKVDMFVTPALMNEGRNHFGCDSLPGIPIEDVPFSGTGGVHFEQRVLNNELMTGAIGFAGGIISRITLALYEDSGWYRPNYEMAQPLRWGYKQGCNFVQEGCLMPEAKTLRPLFCSDSTKLDSYRNATNRLAFRELGGSSSCHYDRGSVGVCTNYDFRKLMMQYDPNFQYFSDPNARGIDLIADYCPYVDGYVNCKAPRHSSLTINAFSETNGPNSKCVEFRIDGNWVYGNAQRPPMLGGGCYEVYCDNVQGPIVAVMGKNFSCTLGKEISISNVDLPNVANVITIMCPPCEDLCWDNLNACMAATSTPVTGGPVEPNSDYDGARTAAAVLFTFMAVVLVLAVAAAVVAGVLFWKGRREQKNGRFEKSSYSPGPTKFETTYVELGHK